MKPKLTLRDLFWLILVVAIGCAWIIDRSKLVRYSGMQASQITALQKQVSQQGFGMQVVYWWASGDEFIQALENTADDDKFMELVPSLSKSEDSVFNDAVTQLIDRLEASEERSRRRAIVSLAMLQQLAANRLDAIVDTIAERISARLDDDSGSVAADAIYSLRSFGPAGSPAVERLKQIMSDDGNYSAPAAAITLHSIDPSLDVAPRLIELVRRKHRDWYSAACFLARHLPPEEAKTVLTEVYDSFETESDRQAMVQALNQIKP